MKTPLILVGLACSILGVSGTDCLSEESKPADPVVNGHPLSFWLTKFDNRLDDHDDAAAEQAIKQLGTNAIPFLIHQMRYDERAQKGKLSAGELADAMNSAGLAARGLALLEGSARSEIPELTALMNSDDSWTVRIAANVLKKFGSEGAKAIVVGLTNRDKGGRLETSAALYDLGTNTFAVVPDILRNMDHLEWDVAANCARAILYSGAPTKMVVRGFIEKLNSTNATCRMVTTWYLERLGTNAFEAIPYLQKLQSDPDKDVRSGAKQALAKIKADNVTH